ncbi:MAG TPA: hypothetical protein VEB86_02845, partial [Chryseosolibacter sp.]|nr:hypothetical protein [Chryseosolibacter sp.]
SEFVNAAGWLLTRKCIETVGLFEPLFPLYGEDQNYTQRLRFHGLFLGIIPAARMVHDRAERQGGKNSAGRALEASTFVLTRLLNINNSMLVNIFNSLKVFRRYGINRRSLRGFLSGLTHSIGYTRLRDAYRCPGYLLKPDRPQKILK